jgi:hypothetical protein
VCKEYAFVETHVLDDSFVHAGTQHRLIDLHPVLGESPLMQFYPGDELNQDLSNWFAPNVPYVELMLQTSGFRPTLAGRWGSSASFMAVREEFLAILVLNQRVSYSFAVVEAA